MNVRARFWAALAGQLARPHGPLGRLVAGRLNRGNRSTIVAAVELLGPRPGERVGDVGFGGGLGLEMLISGVGRAGVVHGIDISSTAVTRAGRRFRTDVASGRLVLNEAPMAQMPLPDGSLNALMTLNTIYFIDDLTDGLSEIARVLAPTGRLVLGFGDPVRMEHASVTTHGFRLRPVGEVLDSAARAGLRVDRHDHVGDGMFNLILAHPG